MIYETTRTWLNNPLVANSPIIKKALAWAESVTKDTEPGRFDLQRDDMYALVQRRESSPRIERKQVEAHREYVDLQYCVSGSEIIDWYPLEALTPISEYDAKNDVQLFRRPSVQPLPLLMQPDCFTLLFPDDGHVPMVATGSGAGTCMIVFKIRLSVL